MKETQSKDELEQFRKKLSKLMKKYKIWQIWAMLIPDEE